MKIITLILSLVLSSTAMAHTIKSLKAMKNPQCGVFITLSEAVNIASKIVEGIITGAETFEKEGNIYTKYTLHSTKVFKGSEE